MAVVRVNEKRGDFFIGGVPRLFLLVNFCVAMVMLFSLQKYDLLPICSVDKRSNSILSKKTYDVNNSKPVHLDTTVYDSVERKVTSKGTRKSDRNYFQARHCSKRFPDSLIIGVQKCGTTALSKFLSVHPQISIRTQQAYYFTSNYFLGLDWYFDFLPCSTNDQVVIERTPQYFYSNKAPRRIRRANNEMKLILIVCEPVRRLLSNFAMAKHRLRESESHDVDEVILTTSQSRTNKSVDVHSKYVLKSMYHLYIKNWLQEFSLDRILLLDGEIFARTPVAELRKVERFLGIAEYFKSQHFILNSDTGFNCVKTDIDIDCLPKSKGNRDRDRSSANFLQLKQFFKDQNKAFFKAVNRTFNW